MEIESNNRNSFSPASALLEAHLDSRSLREEWKDMLLSELKYTFYIKIKPTFFQRLKKIVPLTIKMYLKKSLRS
jgi:hypothetical protein